MLVVLLVYCCLAYVWRAAVDEDVTGSKRAIVPARSTANLVPALQQADRHTDY